MGIAVVTGATYVCTFGTVPGVLKAAQAKVLAGGAPAAVISDVAPMAAITPCGLCTTVSNPAVAAATAAALGVLTPQPCIPAPVGTWLGSRAPQIAGTPGLSSEAKLLCSYGGLISVVSPGQTKVMY
ncbi:MAG: DUF4280 domain-containing protein [Gracilibacteraceae bacterium]|jgi:hypothetical protein|nr:DUF4280 domain-containing protein [Gracilibacteraceae bacterium]